MKRFWSALVALCLVAAVLVVGQPTIKAEATTTWPISQELGVHGVYAHDNGNLSFMSCNSGHLSSPGAFLADEDGNLLSTLPSQEFCLATYGETSEAGVFYSYRTSGSQTFVSAWKNDRRLWQYEITSPTDCTYASGTSYNTRLLSPSIGDDGNLYAIASGAYDPSSCVDRLIGIDVTTGTSVFTPIALSAGPSTGYWFEPRAWTYEDTIVTVDRDGLLHEFDYAGTENTSAQYQFTPGSGRTIRVLAADADGTVFASTAKTSGPNNEPAVLYRKTSGATGGISNPYSIYPPVHLLPVANGRVASIGYNNQVDIFDTSTSPASFTNFTLTNSSGFSKVMIVGYVEDEEGNAMVIRKYNNSSYTMGAVGVDIVAAGTQTPTNVFYEANATSTPDLNVTASADTFAQSIRDGYLYLSLCKDGGGCGSGASSPLPNWVYKIALTGFGEPVSTTLSQNDYVDTQLEYVAMGDSFSSGEGLETYLPGTDTSTNKCHRSPYSYPIALDDSTAKGLNLTAFVACSGATTNTLTNGGTGTGSWGESAQISALSNSTEVVTLTIGGNDIGFSEVLKACAHAINEPGWGCANNTSINTQIDSALDALSGETTVVGITSITSIIDTIDSATDGASIYIGGYPHLFGNSVEDFDENTEAPGGAACLIGAEGISVSYDDAQWMNDRADELNSAISDAVDEAREINIDVTYVPTNFVGHGWCDDEETFLNPIYIDDYSPLAVNPGSMHPNDQGVVEGYLFPFLLLIN